MLRKYRAYRLSLTRTELNDQRTFVRQQVRCAPGNRPIGVEAVRAAIESQPRLMTCYLRLQLVDLGARI